MSGSSGDDQLRSPGCAGQFEFWMLGWMTGFEPATSGATVRRSTAELHPPYRTVTARTSRNTLRETLIVTYRARPILP